MISWKSFLSLIIRGRKWRGLTLIIWFFLTTVFSNIPQLSGPSFLPLFSFGQIPNLIETNYLPTPPWKLNIAREYHSRQQFGFTFLNLWSQRSNCQSILPDSHSICSSKLAFSFPDMTILVFPPSNLPDVLLYPHFYSPTSLRKQKPLEANSIIFLKLTVAT